MTAVEIDILNNLPGALLFTIVLGLVCRHFWRFFNHKGRRSNSHL